jgi:hypothetical protein
MARSVTIGLRVPPEVKAAAARAAKDDRRPVASLIQKLLTEWLEEHGYLPTQQAASPPAHYRKVS